MAGEMEPLKYLRRSDQSSTFADSAAQSEWNAQKWTWIIDDKEGFVAATIVKDKGETCEVRLSSGLTKEVNKNDTFKMNPPKFDKVEDMAELAYLNEPAVLDNLRKRYHSNLIYTYSGLFCVVVNPYKRLPIYSNDVVELYRGRRRQEMPPHVYAIADQAYRDMLQDRENQSVLITGESGAGKTENTKKVIQYLAHIATAHDKGHQQLEEQLLQCNPVLEAFGNAKTIKNDNSSRFGKFIRIEFDRSGTISGGNIETYLLEKSRAIRQQTGERNFHIYYQLIKAATPEMREEFLLDSIDEVPYLTDKESSRVDGVDDVAEFAATVRAMETVGISEAERKCVWRTLSAIMKLGQMKFSQDRSEQAQMLDDTKAAMICKLLGLNLADFIKAMLKPRMKVGRDYVTKAQRADEVVFNVESIAKAMHERVFLWIVKKINAALDTRRTAGTFIGILDIAGFEIFQNNSFEQLCINFTNEKLQQFFNNHMFIVEQEEYKREGIQWDFINFGLDLQPCIDLIEKPMGVLSLLDEEVLLLPRSSDNTLVEKLDKAHASKSEKYAKQGGKIKRDNVGFCVMHYAGTVEYTCDGWLVKNKDPVSESLQAVLAASSDDFTRMLWDDGGFESGRGRRTGQMRTVAQTYRDQLTNLMTTLNNTAPHFVRCIIPNHQKKPGRIDVPIVLDQLRCNGVLEGIRICRKGFPSRVPFQEFRQRYEILTPGAVEKGFMDGRKACEKMLEVLEVDKNNYRIGSSKVFFRTGVLGMLEEMRDERLSALIRNLQAHCRAHLARKSFNRLTNHEVAVKIIQRNARKYLMLRTWPWWKLFVRVQPLLKVTQEDNLKRELDDARRRAEDVAAKNETLARDVEALTAEKGTLKAELDRTRGDLDAVNQAVDRYQARTEQLAKELESLEDRLDEEAAKADALHAEKKVLGAEKQALEAELNDAKDKLEKLTHERSVLDQKLRGLDADLIAERDAHHKVAKEKASLESQLAGKEEAIVHLEERVKTLTKAKSKGEGAVSELEERLANMDQERADLLEKHRALGVEAAGLRDRLHEAQKQAEDVRADLARKTDELAGVQAALDQEQQRTLALEKQARELNANIESLREELDAEQSAVAKLRKEKQALDAFVKELEDRVEDKSSASAAQADLRAKREAELASLKQKFDQAAIEHEATVQELKRKAQAQQEALESDLAQSSRAKAELEKRAAALKQEIDVLDSKLQAESKDRADTDKKKRALEAQLADANIRLQETQRQLEEANGSHERVARELSGVQKTLDEREAALSQMEREKASLVAKVEELQGLVEDETRQKLSFQTRARAAEQECDAVKEQLAEKEDAIEAGVRQQNALRGQVEELKAKAARDAQQADDAETARKKLMRDNEALAGRVSELESAKAKLHETAARLQGENDDLASGLDAARNEAQAALKKAKKADTQISEARAAAHEAETKAQQAEAEASRLGAELYTLRAQLDEALEDLAKARKDNSALRAELDDVKNGATKDAGYVASLEKAKRTLQQQLDDQKAEMEELEDELQQVEDAKVRLEVSMQALRQQMERERAEREEGIEEGRKGLVRQARQLEEELEEERRGKAALAARCKKLETDLMESQRVAEDADKLREEAVKQAKKAAQQARDQQQELDDTRASFADLENRAREAERKAQRHVGENATLQAELERAEKSRKGAEVARDEAHGELDALRRDLAAAVDSKRRVEADLALKADEVEELATEVEQLQDKDRRTAADLEQALQQLAQERDNVARLDQKLQTLERANAELREQVDGAARDAEKKLKTRVMALETKLAGVQAELDQETRKTQDALSKCKRLDRKNKDMARLLDEAEKTAAEAKANFDRINSKVRNTQTQMEELEQEVNSVRQKNRRLQGDLNEATEVADQLRSQLASAQARQSRLAARRRNSNVTEENVPEEVTAEHGE